MFFDTFSAKYQHGLKQGLKKKKKKKTKDMDKTETPEKRSGVAPLVGIFSGILLLVGAILAIEYDARNGHLPSINTSKLRHIKMPSVKFWAQQAHPATSPVIAAHYDIKQLYAVEGVKCPTGRTLTLWQEVAGDGSTIFGSVHGKKIVGSLLSKRWTKGGSEFSVATFEGGRRSIVEMNRHTHMVQKINSGDGCLFMSKCAHIEGRWERDESVPCAGKKAYEIRQDRCEVTYEGKKGVVRADVLFQGTKKIGHVRSANGALKMFDMKGCVYNKVPEVHE